MENIDIATLLVLQGIGITKTTNWQITHSKVKYFQDHCKSLGFSFRKSLMENDLWYSNDLCDWLYTNRDFLDMDLTKYKLKPEVQKVVNEIHDLDTTIKTVVKYPEWVYSMRDATPEEEKGLTDYIMSIAEPTGIKFNEVK